jgi:hypothetical protein
MTLDYLDLDFTLSNRILVVFWPAQNFYCFCELNETRDRVEAAWTGRDTSEARLIANLLKNAGNWYLEELRSSPSWEPRLRELRALARSLPTRVTARFHLPRAARPP